MQTEIEIFKCPVCGKEYKSKFYYDKHIEEKHPDYDVDTSEIDKINSEVDVESKDLTTPTMADGKPWDKETFLTFFKFIPDAVNSLLIDLKNDDESDFQEIGEIWWTSDKEYEMAATALFRFFEMYYPQFLVFLGSQSFLGLVLMLIPVILLVFKKIKRTVGFALRHGKLKKAGKLKSQIKEKLDAGKEPEERSPEIAG